MTAENGSKISKKEAQGKVQPTPVKPQWYEKYKNANVLYPQTFYGISTLVGREIVGSLQKGEVDLAYVANSTLTGDQFNDLIDTTVQAHNAHGITTMPEGHGSKGKDTFTPEFWFHGTWSDTKRSVFRVLSYLAADMDPHKMRQTDILRSNENRLAFNVRRSDSDVESPFIAELIEQFESSDKYGQLLPVVGQLYEAAADALETDEAKELARGRRDIFNSHVTLDTPYDFYPEDFDLHLAKMMKESIDSHPVSNQIGEDKVWTFLCVIKGLSSPVTIKDKLPYAEYVTSEWKHIDATRKRVDASHTLK